MRRSSPRYSSPSRGQTWWINLYLAHSAAAHALFPSSPLLSLFLKCQASFFPPPVIQKATPAVFL